MKNCCSVNVNDSGPDLVQKRRYNVTLQGEPVSISGVVPQRKDQCPHMDGLRCSKELASYNPLDHEDKIKVISFIPSIDTEVCSKTTRKFDEDLAAEEDTVVLTVSRDLPFAAQKWCGNQGLPNTIHLSTYQNPKFFRSFGVLIKKDCALERLCCRAIFVIDVHNVVRHVEIVPEVTNEPNYEAVYACIKRIREKAGQAKENVTV